MHLSILTDIVYYIFYKIANTGGIVLLPGKKRAAAPVSPALFFCFPGEKTQQFPRPGSI